jgi:hypothetical protein
VYTFERAGKSKREESSIEERREQYIIRKSIQ